MFGHLDDPSPPVPNARTLGGVLGRAARIRRRRAASALGVVGTGTLALGVVIGLLVPRSSPAQAVTNYPPHGELRTGALVHHSDLADVVFVGRTDGFALALHGEQTGVAASRDGGDTWRVVTTALPTGYPAQLDFTDVVHGYLWGGAPNASGTLPLWMTGDGGRTWTDTSLGPVVSDVSAIGADVWAVVGTCPISSSVQGKWCPVDIEVSLDHGATWAPSELPPPMSENSGVAITDQDVEMARITPTRAYVLAFESVVAGAGPSTGRLVFTSDGGRTWQSRSDPCPGTFGFGEQIAASSTNDLWMTCASQASAGSQAKALYRSSDGGSNWSLAAAANAPLLSGDVSLPAGGHFPVGGYVSPYSLGHANLAVLTSQQAWLFPDRTGVFQTIDGGRTWKLASGLASAGLVGGGIGNVVFVDATHGWACQAGSGLWRTADGSTWRRLGP